MANSSVSVSYPLSVIHVDTSVSAVKCNGGSEALGHPEVYYTFGDAPSITCDYCGQIFLKSST